MLPLVELIASFVLVALAADAVTNAVEWIDARTGLTSSASGAIVAALGSSLPETIVAFIALVVLRDPRSQAIGIGAVIGAPVMLGTVVLSLMGVLALVRARRGGRAKLEIPVPPMVFGATLFIATFALALAASFVSSRSIHIAAAIAVLLSYAGYLFYHLRVVEPEAETAPPRLRIAPRLAEPPMRFIAAQLVIALAMSALASRWLVASLSGVAALLAIAPFVMSLVLSPIATEVPEAMSVTLWLRRGEDTLALNNVIGAMMFQTSIACAIAILATPWVLPRGAYVAGAAVLLAMAVLVVVTIVRRRVEPSALALTAIFYIALIATGVLSHGAIAESR
jgi:cation:H+ antiporter